MPKKRRYRRRKYGYKPINIDINPEAKKAVVAILLLGVGALSALSFFNLAGQLGEILDNALSLIFGSLRLLFALTTALVAATLLFKQIRFISYLGLVLFFFSLGGLVHSIAYHNQDLYAASQLGQGGGYIGFFSAYPLTQFAGFFGAILINIALLLISLILTFNTSFHNLAKIFHFIYLAIKKLFVGLYIIFSSIKNKGLTQFERREFNDDEKEAQEEKNENIEEYEKEESESHAPTPELIETVIIRKRRRKVEVPLTLLGKKSGKATAGDIKNSMLVIEKTFKNFNIEVEMGAYSVGPTVTQYTLKPAEGVRLAKITSLSNDLSLSLAAHPIRIEAPIPGQSLVGIEVPNKSIATVNLRDLLASDAFAKSSAPLTVAIGQDVSGAVWTANLAKMPHMLVAGSTGSGKSVCLNAIILSLLYSNSPDDLKLILVDPKRVEFPIFNGIPHLLTPVITDVKKTVNSLKWAIGEMERRFDLLSKVNKKNIESYNSWASAKLPYIIIIIDELADLMAASGAEIEACIIRLAQMSRAIGIHLVVATQRPSVDVITGLIKANITSRIAFAVGSQIDSRTILDSQGAEKLLGKGDMLFISTEISKPKRLQGAFVSEQDAKRVADFLKENYEKPEYNESVLEKQKTEIAPGMHIEGASDEPLIEDAIDVITQAGKASASLLQRRLSVGYARAARLLDILEENGIIGPAEGPGKPRDVLISKQELQEKRIGAPYEMAYQEAENISEAEEEDYEEEENEKKYV